MGETSGSRDRGTVALLVVAATTILVCLGALGVLFASIVGAPEPAERSTARADRGPVTAAVVHGAVVGTVEDAAGRPVAGVYVTVHAPPYDGHVSSGGSWSGTTDARGRYRVDVEAGRYRLSFGGLFGRSYALEYHPDASSFNEAADVDVAGGAEAAVDAVVAPGATVSGRIVDRAGRPLRIREPWASYVSLERRAHGRWSPLGAAVTDRRGRYVASGLPAGRYRLSFRHADAGTVYHPAATRAARAGEVVLDSGAVRAGTDIRVPGPSLLSGRVLAVDGRPLVGVRVAAVSDYVPVKAGGTLWVPADLRTTTTDEDGRYELVGLPTGRYAVWAGQGHDAFDCRKGIAVQWDLRVDSGRRVVQDFLAAQPEGAKPGRCSSSSARKGDSASS